jgi:hypothetical protein
VYVSHYSVTSSFSVRACRTARTGLESVCGPLAWSSSQTNVITLNPGSIWQPTDFGYLEVTIGTGDAPDPIQGYVLVY